jgi:hypothetical protein
MYAGHFAIGLALKARNPKVPALPLLLGAGFLDLLDGVFIVLGWDRVRADLNAGPYLFFDLRFVDWDHSLLMASVWSLAWGALFLKDKRVALLATLAAFSHILADWPVHNHDLALFPFAETHLGWGLWGRLGAVSWILEGFFVAALCGYATARNARRGVRTWRATALIALLFVGLSPWLSPMKLIAQLAEPAAHLLHGALVAFGFLVPALALTWLVERAERA